ncbi:MAG: AAA family ATPase [Candidatus Omnitrophica bacterium]|nr:AAA family ATPase [Candidatus Omnitrophota bacterium]
MSFQDIKGHDNIIHFFKREMELKKLASAYLFFGPDAVGKTFLATTLAKALNCLNMSSDSCDNCISCFKIKNKNHPDVVFVENKNGKESIGIEVIRELQERINLKPYEGRTKVFIIQDSHKMTQEAQNCFLKTLEEPPRDSIIFLITPKPEDLLLTVRSRCKQIKFGPLNLTLRIELANKQGFFKDEALFLSRLTNSGFFPPKNLHETKGGQNLIDYKNSIIDEFSGNNDILLDEKNFIFSEAKGRMKFIISIIESWFRDILVLKSTGDASLIINSDKIKDLKLTQKRFSFEELEEILKEIEMAHFYIERNVGPKMAFNNLKTKIRNLSLTQ